MIRPDGTVDPRKVRIYPNRALVLFSQQITPPTARMVQQPHERITTKKGTQNFEILYNGVASGALQLTYREFSPDDLARTAFYQNLSYDPKADSIRFKNFRIRIHSANSEAIEYTVLEDGQ